MKSIILVNPDPLFSAGIRSILSQNRDIYIKAVYIALCSLEKVPENELPDLLICDESMARLPGCHASNTHFGEYLSKINTIIFHNDTNPGNIRRYIDAGIRGYLLKCVQPEELLKAVTEVLNGNLFIQESVRQSVLEQSLGLCSRKKQKHGLTQREIQIIQLIVEEYSTHEIASKLFISFNTVESHRKNLILKLGVRNSAGLVREAFKLRLYPNNS